MHMNLGRIKELKRLVDALSSSQNGSTHIVEGSWGSFAPALASFISKQTNRGILYLSHNIDKSDKVYDDLTLFSKKHILALPAWETQADLSDASDEIGTERLRITMALDSLKKQNKQSSGIIVCAPIEALCQSVVRPEEISKNSLSLSVGETIEPSLIKGWLSDAGFENVDRVDMPGEFAMRGGILDIYSSMKIGSFSADFTNSIARDFTKAVRIEFFDDLIESIRIIDLDSQLSNENVKKIEVLPQIYGKKNSETRLFLDMLPEDTIIFTEEISDIQEAAQLYLNRVDDSSEMYDWSEIYPAIQKFTQIQISRFGKESQTPETFKLSVKSIQEYEHRSGPIFSSNTDALAALLDKSRNKTKVLFYCENAAERSRISEILKENDWKKPANFTLKTGFINQGFYLEDIDTIVAPHHQIFGQYNLRRRSRTIRATAPIENFVDLTSGDYVVHVSYGIGKFKGINSLKKNGITSEYLTIEYADKCTIHVPVGNIILVHKYIGSSKARPKLSRIGSKQWENQKLRVAQSLQDLASELLEVQAKREKICGIEFDKDNKWQSEFEESFPYQETADQICAMQEIKDDMISKRPMDRLLCGDVGFGKTEMSMRAAFKAVQSGKQVALLVPTTVLCVQHGRSFRERFADFPVTIETLNRFNTAKQVAKIIEDTRNGRVDILIGTHKILSNKVQFKDLGLLVIDEEQRFGVEHKEKLKKMRVDVDILTMSATPIPRTLHMSMLGLRDISSLASAPLDRRSVTTLVNRRSDSTIRGAIMREINRQGQVFFLHNRVKDIEDTCAELARIVPEAKFAIAHGQMSKRGLEKSMIDFVTGKVDVLVCSTIIESGLDIPNANTIIIDSADRFGLAQLHQLRGRVGRYKHKAFAYLLLPESRPITPIAAKRLKAIEEYSHLGAGFKIALRDLEIRGAGNILGPQQSGHINLIGYEMYCKLLTNSVKKMKNEPIDTTAQTVVNLGFSIYIPKSYIPSERQRMDVYLKIASATNTKDLRNLESEIKDIFGPIPSELKLLIDTTEIRVKATKWKIQSIITNGNDVIFSFPKGDKDIILSCSDLFAKTSGKIKIPDPYTVHLELKESYFEPTTLLSVLRKLFGR